MALQKEKIVKGVAANYWKIVDCNVKTGHVAVALYVNHDAAQVFDNLLDCLIFNVYFPIEVTNPISYAYGKVKEDIITKERVLSENNEMIEVDKVTPSWLGDAVDC